MTILPETLNLPRPLADGLILRRATPADIEAVAALNGRMLVEENEPAEAFAGWTRDLMSGRHPSNTAADFIVVEDSQIGQIVSSACLIPQIWLYDDIPFSVGRPELVVTDPAYRRRGLVRAIFEALHALSAAQDHLVQGITGIPWFYRQFGYEYALPLGGSRNLNLSDVPLLKNEETEPYQLRPATEADIPNLMRLYQRQCAGKLITTQIDETRWRYELTGQAKDSLLQLAVSCVLDQAGNVIGYYSTPAFLWGDRLGIWELVIATGVSWPDVLPTIVRALKAQAETYQAKAANGPKPLSGLRFVLGLEHPAYTAFDAKLGRFEKPYAWYIRVADVPRFIRHIAPVLEKRLAASVISSYSGELSINFYQGGLRLVFERGRLIAATDWQPPNSDRPWDRAAFPPLVFLQLLFGYRSLDELRHAFPDCSVDEEAALILNALFPKQVSLVFPLG